MGKKHIKSNNYTDDLAELKMRLKEAEDTLSAIRNNEVDALVVKTQKGDQVFTLTGADYAYRIMIEMMNDGALIISLNGNIFYSNNFFAQIVKAPLEKMIGNSILNFIKPQENKLFQAFLKHGYEKNGRHEFYLQASDGELVPVLISATNLHEICPGSICLVVTDISERKQSEEYLRKSQQDLLAKSKSLEELNTALKVLLRRMEESRIELEEIILSNMKELVLPYLEELKKTQLSEFQMSCISNAETNLDHIASSFLHHLKMNYLNLTPREIQIAAFVKDGKSVKEIAKFLNVSSKTVEFHKNSLRNKLGLKKKKTNLRAHLLTF
jgi:PAS domain S-box-containing protein